jgi:hypothetical protein
MEGGCEPSHQAELQKFWSYESEGKAWGGGGRWAVGVNGGSGGGVSISWMATYVENWARCFIHLILFNHHNNPQMLTPLYLYLTYD